MTAQGLTHSTNYLQAWLWKAGLLTKKDSPRGYQPLPAPYKWLIHDSNIINEPNRTT